MVAYRGMFGRADDVEEVRRLLRLYPVVALLGARQVGKTTLAKEIVRTWTGGTTDFDLEDPHDLERPVDASTTRRPLKGLIVFDEVQRRPELFPLLRVLADRVPKPARFLILGSASCFAEASRAPFWSGRNHGACTGAGR